MNKKLIGLYKEWIRTGKIVDSGLCFCVPTKYEEYLDLFEPTREDRENHKPPFLYWASDSDKLNDVSHYYDFNEFRQTIVLLICAMCDEL